MFVVLFGLQISASACDACGAAMNSTGVGLLQAYQFNFVGVSYGHIPFYQSTGNGHDIFHSTELSVRKHFSPRFKVLAFLPFHINMRHQDERPQSLRGIGDARILGSFTLLDKTNAERSTSTFFELGAGTKLPTGSYDTNIHDRDLPDNFNIGNGAWAALIQPNFLFSKKNWGISLSGNLQLNGKSSDGYRFGHQANTQALGFFQKKIKNEMLLIPTAGFAFEKIGKDRFSSNKTVQETGGTGLFAPLGFSIRWKKWMLGSTLSIPFYNSFAANEVRAGVRSSAQFLYIF